MDENQLIVAYLKGDEQALELLINQYLKRVYLYFLKRTNDVAAAEDLTQETFIKMWRNLKKFDLKKKFQPWLFVIARNTLIDYLRKYKNGLCKEVIFSKIINGENEGLIDNFIINPILVIDSIEQKEKIEKFKKNLDNLSKSDRDLLENRLAGFKFKELAEKFNTSINTIKARYHRLLKKQK